ncbi:type II toxin-antitoxin system RelE/ParE family toxin [Amycolatopsis albispora]|uniref:type II toxin-antitoxin system RelE/ParE family toxin n=1 Tax=Amycolatopsis albispora TaxID=1804986 RepID=UPI000DE2C194
MRGGSAQCGSGGSTEVRILFAFDPRRRAILLVGGDKAGDWRGWYTANIPVAERRYDQHLRGLEEAGT